MFNYAIKYFQIARTHTHTRLKKHTFVVNLKQLLSPRYNLVVEQFRGYSLSVR